MGLPAFLQKLLHGTTVSAVVARGASGALGVSLAGAAIALGTQMLLTNLLGRQHYGDYVYALSWALVLSVLSRLGLDVVVLKYVSIYRSHRQWGLLRGILRSTYWQVGATSLGMSAAAAAVVWGLHARLEGELLKTLLIACLVLPVLALAFLRQSALRSLKRVVLAQIPERVLLPIFLSAMVVVSYVAFPELLSASTAMILHFVSLCLVLAVSTRWLLRSLPSESTSVVAEYRGREWLLTAFPLLLVASMNILFNTTGVLIVGAVMGTAEAGNYAIATRLAMPVAFGLVAVNSIAAPMIAELHDRGAKAQLQKMLKASALGILAFTVPITLLLAVLGRPLLALFDPSYVQGYYALLFLLGAQFVNASAGSLAFLMTMTGYERDAALMMFFSTVLNVVLNFVLIGLYGLAGAGAAMALSMAAMNVGMYLLVRKRIGVNPTVMALITRERR